MPESGDITSAQPVTWQQVGLGGSANNFPFDINDRSDVVGVSDLTGDTVSRAVLWKGRTQGSQQNRWAVWYPNHWMGERRWTKAAGPGEADRVRRAIDTGSKSDGVSNGNGKAVELIQ
jgi:hypothetical protein